jgi:calcineurin-like phosphoesterase
VNVKVYVVSSAEGLLKLNSNTAGLPSVAEAGVIVATVGAASLSLIVPVAEAVPEAMLKSSLFSSIVSAVVGTPTVPVAPAGGYCLRCGSVISTSSGSIGECKAYVVLQYQQKLLKLNSNTAGLPSVAEAGDRGYSWHTIIISK